MWDVWQPGVILPPAPSVVQGGSSEAGVHTRASVSGRAPLGLIAAHRALDSYIRVSYFVYTKIEGTAYGCDDDIDKAGHPSG